MCLCEFSLSVCHSFSIWKINPVSLSIMLHWRITFSFIFFASTVNYADFVSIFYFHASTSSAFYLLQSSRNIKRFEAYIKHNQLNVTCMWVFTSTIVHQFLWNKAASLHFHYCYCSGCVCVGLGVCDSMCVWKKRKNMFRPISSLY